MKYLVGEYHSCLETQTKGEVSQELGYVSSAASRPAGGSEEFYSYMSPQHLLSTEQAAEAQIVMPGKGKKTHCHRTVCGTHGWSVGTFTNHEGSPTATPHLPPRQVQHGRSAWRGITLPQAQPEPTLVLLERKPSRGPSCRWLQLQKASLEPPKGCPALQPQGSHPEYSRGVKALSTLLTLETAAQAHQVLQLREASHPLTCLSPHT